MVRLTDDEWDAVRRIVANANVSFADRVIAEIDALRDIESAARDLWNSEDGVSPCATDEVRAFGKALAVLGDRKGGYDG